MVRDQPTARHCVPPSSHPQRPCEVPHFILEGRTPRTASVPRVGSPGSTTEQQGLDPCLLKAPHHSPEASNTQAPQPQPSWRGIAGLALGIAQSHHFLSPYNRNFCLGWEGALVPSLQGERRAGWSFCRAGAGTGLPLLAGLLAGLGSWNSLLRVTQMAGERYSGWSPLGAFLFSRNSSFKPPCEERTGFRIFTRSQSSQNHDEITGPNCPVQADARLSVTSSRLFPSVTYGFSTAVAPKSET